jgi:carboxyl-terminal processing protease
LSKQNESQNTFEDSLKYKTKNGRFVYGGGGIFPDIIIKQDTSLNFFQINLIISKGWIGEFSLNQSVMLNKIYIDKEDFIKNLNKDIIYNSFLDFLEKKDDNITLDIGAVEKIYLKTLLKANIARNIWDNNTYFEILNQQDESIKSTQKCKKNILKSG